MPPWKWSKKTRRRKQKGGAQTPKAKSSQPNPGPAQCHPSLGVVSADIGCLPITALRSAAKKIHIPSSVPDTGLKAALKKALNIPGEGEHTFLQALPLSSHEKMQLAKKYLRPPAPKAWTDDPDMWLDSNNISAVMNQYEEIYTKNGVKEFEFMGPFPIDFAAPDPYKKAADGKEKCLMHEICEIRVEKALKNGTRSIGIVYNLDPHFKSGSHWVANYIDIPGHACYYFDSYGMEPPPQVAKFMKWLTTQDPAMKLQYNKRRLQYSNTECGVYCIYVIIRLLSGDSFLDITRRRPKDADMLDLRDWIFST